MSCATCNCPADVDWLPCATECLQEERLWRLRSREEYIPLPPLPVSDDESDESDDSHSYVPSETADPLYSLTHPCESTGWTSSPSSEAYRNSLGHLAKIPHILQEAELIHGLLSENINTVIDLIYALFAMDLPRNVFARSIPASVRWHLSKMEEAGVIHESSF